jgi:hypothetical protein
MAKISSVALTDTFSEWLDEANIAYARLNQFTINESALYANTITANNTLILGVTTITASGAELNYTKDVTSAIQTQLNTKQTVAIERAALANTNAYIATMQTIAVERAALANTNAYIASMSTDVQLANTNAYIAAVVTSLNQRLGETATVALTGDITASATAFSGNTVSIATTDTNLGNTNSYIATMQTIAQSKAYLANTNTYIATKTTESTALSRLANTNAYIATMMPKAGGTFTGLVTLSTSLSSTDLFIVKTSGNSGTGLFIHSGTANQIDLVGYDGSAANALNLRAGGASGAGILIDTSNDVSISNDLALAGGVTMTGTNDFTISGTGNRYIGITSTDALASMEIGGATGAFIDFKDPATDDYDMRIGSSTAGGYINTAGSDLTISANVQITASGGMGFNDSSKAIWGTSDDGLEIYHDGSNSYIADTGTGDLYIRASNALVMEATNGENYITGVLNGAVELYYDNVVKISTSAAGSTLAGTTSGTFSGNITGNVTGNVSGSSGSTTGNAATATALASARTIAMTGDVTWTSASFDGTGNVTGVAAIGSGVIVDADVNSGAAIAWSKMANLTASRALYSGGSGDVSAHASVTSTELGYLDGVTSAIQTQMDAKAPLAAPALTGTGTFYSMAGRVYTATTSGSVTLDFANYTNFNITLNGNLTLANPSTEVAGMTGMICLIQDGTGSRTLSLGTDYETTSGTGITLSTAASKTDLISYFVHSSGRILLGDVNQAFS